VNPRIEAVVPNAVDSTLGATLYQSGIPAVRRETVLVAGFFYGATRRAYFNSARIALGSIEWPHGQGFCPDTLYETSQPITESVTIEATVA